MHFDAGLARGEGGLAPAAIVAAEKNDYAFLSLKSPAFDLSDRGVAGRQSRPGSMPSSTPSAASIAPARPSHITALLRDARGAAALNVPLDRLWSSGLMASNIDAPSWPIGGLGGRSLTVPIVASASTGTWRVAAYTDPKRPPVGETTFHGRGLRPRSHRVSTHIGGQGIVTQPRRRKSASTVISFTARRRPSSISPER